MKAHASGSILLQYFSGTNYFHLLLGLRSFQKSEFSKSIIFIFPEKKYLKLLFFIMKIQNFYQSSGKKQIWGLNHVVRYTNQFSD